MKRKRKCFVENGVCYIPLSNLELAFCDADRIDLVQQYSWSVNTSGYPTTNKNGRGVRLHQLLFPNIKLIDHINTNKLDNRSANIRPATIQQNSCNKKKFKCNKTGYKGVHFTHRKKNKYMAVICVNRKTTVLGRYESAIYAAIVYDNAARRLHGEFANLNFPTVF